MTKKTSSWLVLTTWVAAAAGAQSADLDVINRIRAEALERSQVMETARELTDEIGPRLTGSPALKRANAWSQQKFEEWGLSRSRLEPFEFGDGWSYTRAEVRMLAPLEVPMAALPKAWTPGTTGAVRGAVVRAELDDVEDFEAQKGKLSGKIVFLDGPREETPVERGGQPDPDFERYDDERLDDLAEFEIREPRVERWRAEARKRDKVGRALAEFLVAEGAVATVELSSRDYGILRGGGDAAKRDRSRPRGVPGLYLAAEPYQRVLRLLDQGEAVELEIDIASQYHAEDPNAYNTIAEIPGTDRRGELVLAGAHLDSWHAGTGATDDGAGCAVVLEAARILKAIGVKPRRTLRFALWGGEEQGLVGSRAYVWQYVADRPEPTDPEQLALPRWLRDETWPIRTKPEHGRISAYFNLDNGGGKVRGIYTQGNVAVTPIFQSWLAPLADLGATTVTNRSTGSTDHVSFDRVGVPGFQFIQDPLDYGDRTHHTQLDTFERLKREDLVQASIVMATFLYQAAMREEPLPRKPMPQAPPKPAAKPEPAAPEQPSAATG